MSEQEFELAVLEALLLRLLDLGVPVRGRERKVEIVKEMLAKK